MGLEQISGYASVAVTLLIYVIYIPSIFQGKTRPHILSWLIFAALTAIVFLVQVRSGAGAGSWSTGLTAAAMAFYPTFRKSYAAPREEPLSAYILSALKMALAIGATQTYNFYTLAYPAFFLIVYLAFIAMVWVRRKRV